MKTLKYFAIGMALLGVVSCGSDYLDTEDTSVLDTEQAGEAAAREPDAFLNGIWSGLVDASAHDVFGIMSANLALDVMGEDIAFGAVHWFIYDYQLDYRSSQWTRPYGTWSLFYTVISQSNEIIGLYPDGATTSEQQALLGQAYALRGWAYTNLIQIFRPYLSEADTVKNSSKGVPMIFTAADGYTQDEITKLMGTNTVGTVFAQAEKDLTRGVEMLEESGYVRPNKDYVDAHVANGMLARLYLVTRQWQKAAEAASKAHEGYSIMDNAGLHDGFMSVDNEEWMWGFIESSETQTTYASFFSHISDLTPGYAGLAYCPKMIDARLYSQIPDDDYRKSLFNGPDGDDSQSQAGARLPYATLKFGWNGDWTMDYPYMRAAEMVLIEAEAYAHLGQNEKAASVLKELMAKRQPSWNKTSVTVEDVYLQRRIELWGEGFSFYDLKRLNKGIERNYSGSNHLTGYQLVVPAQDVRWTYQIPLRELQENDQITEDDQNP